MRPPAEIRLDEVVRALEGSFALTECVDSEEVCDRSDLCVARDLWSDVGQVIERHLTGITLDRLALDSVERAAGGLMYHI